jgi:hypothetical protein
MLALTGEKLLTHLVLPRTHTLRSRVNRGRKKGRGFSRPQSH